MELALRVPVCGDCRPYDTPATRKLHAGHALHMRKEENEETPLGSQIKGPPGGAQRNCAEGSHPQLQLVCAPMARRCWKHSRQKTGLPCVGRKGTVVSLPHCEQVVFVSARAGAWPPPPSARFALQLLQRFGSFLKPLSAKNICSPAVKTNSAPHSAHFRTLSWYSIDGSLAPGPAWKAHTPRTMLDGEGEPIDREGRARVPRSCEREAATETQQPKCDRRAVNLRLMGA